jgi:hypothetical protein
MAYPALAVPGIRYLSFMRHRTGAIDGWRGLAERRAVAVFNERVLLQSKPGWVCAAMLCSLPSACAGGGTGASR